MDSNGSQFQQGYFVYLKNHTHQLPAEMSLEEFEFSLEELEQHRAGREAGGREEGAKVLRRQRRAVIKGNNCEYIL